MNILDEILDRAKDKYICTYNDENIEIINRGIKKDIKGIREEYTIVRWIYKDEPRESN